MNSVHPLKTSIWVCLCCTVDYFSCSLGPSIKNVCVGVSLPRNVTFVGSLVACRGMWVIRAVSQQRK